MHTTNSRSQDIKESFSQWCQPKRGTSNPESMTNILWVELINNKYCPYKAHKEYGTGQKLSPGWCFERYGQSNTTLPDGTEIFIGGEHEDYYDEDFYIYNDVIVRSPNGEISIYGYPKDIFPPTDSHSANLIGNEIFVIGCIGYPDQHAPTSTPVYILDLENYSFRKFDTHGTNPSSLIEHQATFKKDKNTIACTDGQVFHPELKSHIENVSQWELCLTTGLWTLVGTKPWSRWLLERQDKHRNNLSKIRDLIYSEQTRRLSKFTEGYRTSLMKQNYPLDADDFHARYTPPLKHSKVPDDTFRRHSIRINNTLVRYDEDDWGITVTIEGDLPDDIISTLKSHGLETFSRLEATPYEIIDL